jgi:hypothetical protein
MYMQNGVPVVEPYVVTDTLATALVRVDDLGGGLMRFVYAVDQFNGQDTEQVIVCKVVMHTEAARTASKSILHIIGKLLMRNCVECLQARESCH